jgi:hypothetical protein
MIKHVSESVWQGSRLVSVAGMLQGTRVQQREFEWLEGEAMFAREGLVGVCRRNCDLVFSLLMGVCFGFVVVSPSPLTRVPGHSEQDRRECATPVSCRSARDRSALFSGLSPARLIFPAL